MLVICLLTAPPASEAVLRNVFKNTTDLNKLCILLFIPDDKRDFDSAVEYYARSTDPLKLRKMIFILDGMGDTSLAESVVDYAELPAGMTVPASTAQPVNCTASSDIQILHSLCSTDKIGTT